MIFFHPICFCVFLCINQQFNNQIIIWHCGKSNCSICELIAIIFVNKSFCGFKGWLMIFSKNEIPSTFDVIFFPWLLGSNDLICVVLINITWKGDNNPFIDDEIMNVICLLSFIFNILMCLVPSLSHMCYLVIGTRCTII